MDEENPQDLGTALAVLRTIVGLDQAGLARTAGVPASSVSDYERGVSRPTARNLDRLTVVGMGLPPSALEAALSLVRAVRGSQMGSPAGTAAARFGSAAASLASSVLEICDRSQPALATSDGVAPDERHRAPALWDRLRRHGATARRAVVQESQEFRSRALCELLCEESVKAAADDPDRAGDLAELALLVASLLPGDDRERSCLQSHAWAFLGNARRVQSNLPSADEAFARSARLWQGDASAESRPLDGARRLDLEASLRRAQRRLPEALSLLDRALAVGREESRGRILIKKSKTLEELDDPAGAVEALREAAPLVEKDADDPRLLLCVRFNLLVNLCLLDRHAEAAPLLNGVRELTERLGNDLDLVRLRWLEGRVAAGLHRTEEATDTLRQVRDAFADRDIAYDAALATLELSVLYLEQGRTGEVRALAREMAPVFGAQGVHREALAALRIFCEAAEREEATDELARRVLDYLLRGRHEQGVRFGG